MNKLLLVPISVVGIILFFFAIRFISGGQEDTWLCENAGWVKHGNPTSAAPTTPCGTEQNSNQPSSDEETEVTLDEHGCRIHAGYGWCESKGRCQLTAESCPEVIEDQPVLSEEETQTMVRSYIEDHIAELSPEEPVMGGSWYVTDIAFEEDQTVIVTAEDGHIETRFSAQYTVDNDNNITLENIIKL